MVILLENKVNESILKIPNTKPAHSGQYYCKVKSEGYPPIVSSKAHINIIEQLKFISTPPTEKKIELGTTAKLHCKTNYPLDVKWVRNDSKQFLDNVLEENGTLIIVEAVYGNQGYYTCVANSSIHVTTYVYVVVSPKFTIKPPKSMEVTNGEDVLINCVAKGDPKPSINWDKDMELDNFNTDR